VGSRGGLDVVVVKRKNSQPLPGLEPKIIQLVAQLYTTEMSWLLHDIAMAAINLREP
jgi:hypothetical protein